MQLNLFSGKNKNDKVRGRLIELFREFSGKPVVVAYSGGKDSTYLLHHVVELLVEMRTNPLVVVYADTMVENPVIHNHAMRFLDKLKAYCDGVGLDARILIAKPEIKSTYWVNVIGKGYPLPNFRFRWCQDKLKIKPIKKVLSLFSDGFMLVAVRMDESTARKKSLSKRLNSIELERNHLRVFVPIYDITEDGVWEFLVQSKTLWGETYEDVVNLYRTARGECPLIPEKSKFRSGCGMRFGCWVCTVVREDKTLKNQATHDEVLKRLYEFRNWLMEFCDNPKNRLPIRRDGREAVNGKGVLTLQARQRILEELQKLEKATDLQLLTLEELDEIKRIWLQDATRFNLPLDKTAGLWYNIQYEKP
jgi:DNA sulfur modification protein DndC